MDIRVLRYFLAIANQGSMTAASKMLNVTQPTLSRQIKDLESELGNQLFIRNSHTLCLTPQGMVLRKRAEEMLELYSKTKSEFSQITDTMAGNIHIGGGETKAMKIIASIIKEIHQKHPEIHFHIYSGNASDVQERLDKGLLDFGLLIMPTDVSKYDFLCLPVKDIWGVIMRKDAPLYKKESLTRNDLINLPLICSHQVLNPHLTYNEFKNWFGKDFDKLNIIATYNLLFNAALLVEQGIGYALGLDKLVNTMNQTNLCFKPLYPGLESGINIVWKKHQVFSAAAQFFLETLKKTLTKKQSDNNA